VDIGEGSWLYSSFAFLHCRSTRQQAVRIGRSSGVYNGSFFDLGPNGEVHIGDYSTLVGAIICSNQKVIIGDYVFIAHEVVLADNYAAIPASDASKPKPEDSASSIEDPGIVIDENVWIGAGAIILSGAHIGTGAIIGAATTVDFQVPDYAVVVGNPGRIVAQRPPG
jgi:acetyltransferase-like isoleucine patch superfamily enzyme